MRLNKTILDRTIKLTEYQTPATSYPRIKLGSAAIVESLYRKGRLYECYNTRPPGSEQRFLYYLCVKSLPVTALEIDSKTWMVDDCPHWWQIQDHALEYHGHVVVAGLGLGLIVHALDANPLVTKITVVERCADVIRLVGPQVPQRKLELIEGDWWDKLPHRKKANGVFFDLWVGESKDMEGAVTRTMMELKLAYKKATVFSILGFDNVQVNKLVDLLLMIRGREEALYRRR